MALAPPAATRGPGDTDFPAGIELPGQGDDRHRRHPELDVRPAAETAAAAAAAAAATDALGLAGDESRSFVVDNPAMEDPANGVTPGRRGLRPAEAARERPQGQGPAPAPKCALLSSTKGASDPAQPGYAPLQARTPRGEAVEGPRAQRAQCQGSQSPRVRPGHGQLSRENCEQASIVFVVAISERFLLYMYMYGHVHCVSLNNPACQIHYGKVFETRNLGPIFIRWKPWGSLRIPSNQKRGGQGLGPWAGLGQGPGTRGRPPLLLLLKIPRLPLGLQHMNMGPKLLT